jgi:hypothetical protein
MACQFASLLRAAALVSAVRVLEIEESCRTFPMTARSLPSTVPTNGL